MRTLIFLFVFGFFSVIAGTAWAQTIDINDATVSLPLKRLRVTSPFGVRLHPITGKWQFHAGIDLAARGDTVYSIADGTVNRVAADTISGIYIQIDHADGLQSVYAHLSDIIVLPGETVTAGQMIGRTGATGRVTGEHLHFAIKYFGRFIDPMKFLFHLLLFGKPF